MQSRFVDNILKKHSFTHLSSKYNIFGININAITYNEATEKIIQGIHQGQNHIVTYLPVHGLILACRDRNLGTIINSFDIVAPDGQPVRYALKILHGVALPDRVYGPEHMLRLCNHASEEKISIYLYGSKSHVVNNLKIRLQTMFPNLVIAGYESPPFRDLTPQEDEAVVRRINASGAKLVFIGLGCPSQDHFAFKHRNEINSTMLCVGAAFDFHAGNKKMAPKWMQKYALEWSFRLFQEPKRLWQRYFITNSIFLYKIFSAWLKGTVNNSNILK